MLYASVCMGPFVGVEKVEANEDNCCRVVLANECIVFLRLESRMEMVRQNRLSPCFPY